MNALIDGDIICYAAGFSVERPVYSIQVEGEDTYRVSFNTKKDLNEWISYNVGPELDFNEEDFTIVEGYELQPIANCLHIVNKMITSICKGSKADEYVVYLSGDDNFREQTAVTHKYKGNRTAKKPEYYDKIREHLIKYHNGIVTQGIEADDAMGIGQWKDYQGAQELSQSMQWEKDICTTIICTIDKDLDMIPGWHYNWKKDKLYWVEEEEGMLFFYQQLLTGDTIDNIIGLKGIGPVKAKKILEGCDCELNGLRRIEMEYLKAYDDDFDTAVSRLRENASLLWILRDYTETGDMVVDRIINGT